MKIRLALYATVALLVAYLVWQNERLTKKVNVANQRAFVAEQTVEAERENTRKANEAAKRHSDRADALETDRRDNPLPPVRLCPRPRVSQAGPAAVTGEATQADHSGEDAGDSDSIDIGPALDDFATDAENNLIQCEELIRWVMER